MIKKPSNYWTFEKCKEAALKYNSRNDFRKKCRGSYHSATKNEWLDEICSHMMKFGNKYKRAIYVYIFPDNYYYVGLTLNLERRNDEHLNLFKKSNVFKHKEKTGLIPELIILSDYMDAKLAIIEEQKYIEKYKKEGYITLNIYKASSLGNVEKYWTIENLQKEALKYNKRTEFQKKSSGAYTIAWRDGILNKICYHMIEIKKPNGYWTLEKCKEEASKYKTKTEWKHKSSGSFDSAYNNNWFKEIYK